MPPPRIRDIETGLKLLGIRRRAFDTAVQGLATQLRRGQIDLVQWRSAMRQEIKDLHSTALIIARGGEYGKISYSDWGRLGGKLRWQYDYLNKYADQIKGKAEAALVGEGKFYSEKYLQWRSKLYGGSASSTYWQGVVFGKLPQVPGDGQTRCGTNCGCHLRIEDGDIPGTVYVYWEFGPTEHCIDCIALNAAWNPYVLELPIEGEAAATARGLSLREFVERLVHETHH